MGDDLVKEAAIGIATGHNLSAAAAFHQGIVGRQVEIGPHLVRVMALETGVAQDGQDVIFVGDLVLCLDLKPAKKKPASAMDFNSESSSVSILPSYAPAYGRIS